MKKLENGSVATVVYNSANKDKVSVTLNFSDVRDRTSFTNLLQIGFSKSVQGYNLWEKKSMGSFNATWTASDIAPHDVVFVRWTQEQVITE